MRAGEGAPTLAIVGHIDEIGVAITHVGEDGLLSFSELGGYEPDGGLLGTPALYNGVVYASYTEGGFAAVDAATGKLLYKHPLPGPTWSSPVPIDGQLLMADGAGYLNDFDVSNPTAQPKLIWRLKLGGTIESTPAVWHGWIYVGTRAGAILGIAEPA